MRRLIRPESLPIRPEQIEAVLERCGTTLEWANGFFTALRTGPDVVPLSSWVTHFTLEEAFSDNEEATSATVTFVHLYARVGELLTNDLDALCPDAEDTESLEQFCGGYVAGARLHTGWRTDRLAMGALTLFAILGGLVPASEIKGPDGKPRPDLDDWLTRERADLRVHVRQLWKHWAPARKAAEGKVRQIRQLGRNDACPCGSGKKYKKCCLAA